MKTVFPVKDENPTLDSLIEPIFGNAKAYVIIGDSISDRIVIKNKPTRDADCHMGAFFKEHKVGTIISLQLCSHCYENLKKLGIAAWKCDYLANVRETYQKYIIGGTFERIEPDIIE